MGYWDVTFDYSESTIRIGKAKRSAQVCETKNKTGQFALFYYTGTVHEQWAENYFVFNCTERALR